MGLLDFADDYDFVILSFIYLSKSAAKKSAIVILGNKVTWFIIFICST
jgi:hypothetical protein